MEGRAVLRTLMVLMAYLAGAWVVLLLGGWLRRVLALPPLFDDLLRWGVYAGAVIAGLVAWYYPAIATQGGHGTDGREAQPPDSSRR
jgi:hypothetical protein